MRTFLFIVFAFLAFGSCINQPSKKIESSEAVAIEEAEVIASTEINLPPKPAKFTWFYEMCEYTGTYDSNKHTNEQLENTLNYIIRCYGSSQPFSIFSVDDLARVNKAEVEQYYNEALSLLNTLEFVNTPYLNQIKQKQIKQVERFKLLSNLQIDSYTNPKILLNDNYSKEQCSEYTNALIAGGTELLAMRKKMAERDRDAGNPFAWDRYLEETASDNQLEQARVHVSTFGWWNCVNNSFDRVDGFEMHTSGFVVLFEDVTEICEEP